MTRSMVTGIVLAGGRARRFGGPKLDAIVDGETLLSRATRAVAEVADDILVAGPALPATLEVPLQLVVDASPFDGPLAALAGALSRAQGTLAVVVGGDMPWLKPAVLESMLARLMSDAEIDAITLAPAPAASAEAVLVGVHRRQMLPLALRVEPARLVAAQAVLDGDRSLVRLLDRLRSIEIPASEWLALDPDAGSLRDVDRPADLAETPREFR